MRDINGRIITQDQLAPGASDSDPFAPVSKLGYERFCAACGTRGYSETANHADADAMLRGYVPRGWRRRPGTPTRIVCDACARTMDNTGEENLKYEAEHSVWCDENNFGGPPRFTFVKKAASVAGRGLVYGPALQPTSATKGLRALDQAATAGPWHHCAANEGKCQCGLVWAPDGDTCLFAVRDAESDSIPMATRHQNMVAAIAARNALPALLDVADAARALFGAPITTEWGTLRNALYALDAQDISTFATTTKKQKEEKMALVTHSAPPVNTNGTPIIQTDEHGRVVPAPGRLSAHLSPIGSAVMSGAKLVLVNETGETMLDIVRKLAKGNVLVEAALDDPNGRALILFAAATFIHGVAIEAPGMVPKAPFVARAAQKQIEASTFLLGHQNAAFVRGLGAELMEMFKKIGDAEEQAERLTAGGDAPKLDTAQVAQPETAAR